ncbi:hypothetical protein LV716_18050 [Flagellimonas sp. HMM57]|uniref:hypothetical protein n=1 Tax=unclassified Flagellimonas TaxID=2644544 RepID=UPI0013D47C1D|nr:MULTISPECIES: hypothetical protein [unclassified Flagellimonas]UII76145.1 hypothetical protein LV716_18050 [Flagellimonas sp. HMM57]
MSALVGTNIGYGSFFHAVEAESILNLEPDLPIKNYELFYTGRHAIKALLNAIGQKQTIKKIWLPKYYCQHVTEWLVFNFSNIDFYDIKPFDAAEKFSITNFSDENDVVILNNFWGIFNYDIPKTNDRAICIEDHSHGWLSNGCINSKADFCFASLRKTLPVPLGGILWRPDGKKPIDNNLQLVRSVDFDNIWNDISTAMAKKAEHLKSEGGNVSKEDYLNLIYASEAFLHKQYDVVALQRSHLDQITSFLGKDYASYKRANLNHMDSLDNTDVFQVIDYQNNTTFGLHLVFKNEEAFNAIRKYLIAHDIYPSQLWPDNNIDLPWKYLLNIHVDFRYKNSDMDYITNHINAWLKSYNLK